MSGHAHAIYRCDCGRTVRQCRCWNRAKAVLFAPCPDYPSCLGDLAKPGVTP